LTKRCEYSNLHNFLLKIEANSCADLPLTPNIKITCTFPDEIPHTQPQQQQQQQQLQATVSPSASLLVKKSSLKSNEDKSVDSSRRQSSSSSVSFNLINNTSPASPVICKPRLSSSSLSSYNGQNLLGSVAAAVNSTAAILAPKTTLLSPRPEKNTSLAKNEHIQNDISVIDVEEIITRVGKSAETIV
jgi:hypothetical protein